MRGADVARVLRGARDLMNTNGRHWIKGDMEAYVDEELIENCEAGISRIKLSPKAQVGDVAYCAWGGLKEIADTDELRVEAMEALVRIIAPERYKSYKDYEEESFEIWKTEVEYSKSIPGDYFHTEYPTFTDYWYGLDTLTDREDTLGDIIASWNDDDKRTWEDVKTSLTRAAAKAKSAERNRVTT